MSQVYKKRAEEATALENASTNWLPVEPRPFSANYRKLLEGCRKLPVYNQRAAFFEAIDKHDVLIVTGDTGLGKSTQLPTYLLQLLRLKEVATRMVACTQPRRVAAEGVATRVAEINDVELGAEVGFRVRFNNKTSEATRLVYMTDGLLLKEAENDRNLSKYSYVIVDEVHERGINTDLLMSILKTTLKSRDDIKVIIMSATLTVDKFTAHFPGAGVLSLKGRAFPVSLSYIKEATPDFISSCLMIAIHVHQNEDKDTTDKGGILIFLPGEDHIRTVCGVLKADCPDMNVLPLYSGLPAAQQKKALEPSARRKCIVATNIAETSLTIPDIRYVVDSLLSKQMRFNPHVGMQSLQVGPIAKAQAVQRAGRAGRTAPGKCFRVCTKEAYEQHTMLSPVPAMAYSNMDTVLLKMHEMGFDDPLRFPFVDPPSAEILFRAKEDLTDMGLIENFVLTKTGKLAVKLPVAPIWYCALSAAVKHECVAEIVSLAAMSSIQGDIRVQPRSQPATMASDIVWSGFAHPHSDHITRLNALHAFLRIKAQGRVDLERWCLDHFVSQSAMEEVCQLRDQIKNTWTRELKQSYQTLSMARRPEPGYSTAVRKALAEGLFTHVAVFYKGRYTNVHNGQPGLLLHTSSVSSQWIVYDSFVQYGRQYFQVVTAVEPEWIMDLPYFQDSRLPMNYTRTKFRQPQVKELLDKARKARASSLDTLTRYSRPGFKQAEKMSAVFEDDLDEYEDNVPAPQGIPVADLANNSAPRYALSLLDTRPAFTSPDDVDYSMKWALRDILEKPMKIHLQGTGRYTTPGTRDLDKLLAACFERGVWKTGEYHGLPSPKDLDAGVDNVCAVIGTLLKDMGAVSRERANNMPARKEITHRVINRGETTRVTKKAREEQEISPDREVGSRVLIGIVKTADNSFTFKYYDGAHRALPSSYRPKNLSADLATIEQAELAAI